MWQLLPRLPLSLLAPWMQTQKQERPRMTASADKQPLHHFVSNTGERPNELPGPSNIITFYQQRLLCHYGLGRTCAGGSMAWWYRSIARRLPSASLTSSSLATKASWPLMSSLMYPGSSSSMYSSQSSSTTRRRSVLAERHHVCTDFACVWQL